MSDSKPIKRSKMRTMIMKKKPFNRGGSTNTRASSNNEVVTNSDISDQNSRVSIVKYNK